MAWKGIPLKIANTLLEPLGLEIEHLEIEQSHIVRHPQDAGVWIRRRYITEVFVAVMKEWVVLKCPESCRNNQVQVSPNNNSSTEMPSSSSVNVQSSPMTSGETGTLPKHSSN